MGDDGRPLVTRTSFRFLQTLYNLGPAPEPNLTIWYSARMPDGFRRFASKVAIDTSSLQFESDEIMRRACRWILDESYPSKWELPGFYLRKAWQILKHHIL